MKEMRANQKGNAAIGVLFLALAVGFMALVIFSVGWGWTHFRLWKAEYIGKALEIEKQYQGKAVLAEAEFSRLSRVEQANAELSAAEATAEAIRIVGEAAKNYPEYRQQEFYLALGEALKEGRIQQIVYLPTEAGLPLTEAGKR